MIGAYVFPGSVEDLDVVAMVESVYQLFISQIGTTKAKTWNEMYYMCGFDLFSWRNPLNSPSWNGLVSLPADLSFSSLW